MITTEDRKLLMSYLGYSYIPFNSPLHQLKPRWTSGYWIRKSLINADHRHVQFSKRNTGAIVQKLPDFYDWNWIMKLIEKLNVKEEDKYFHYYDFLETALIEANKQETLRILIAIIKPIDNGN